MKILRELRSISVVTLVTLAMTFVAHLGAVGVAAAVNTLAGLGCIFVVVLLGYAVAKSVPTSLPDLFWVSIFATAAGFPGVPGSSIFIEHVSKLNLIATITPVLAVAGLGLSAKDVALFRATGLQFVFVSVLVFLGTFLGSAVVAEFVLRVTGV
ncbi:MAG: hypothetical protein AAGL49_07135 [Pseudomonadota bacterium]